MWLCLYTVTWCVTYISGTWSRFHSAFLRSATHEFYQLLWPFFKLPLNYSPWSHQTCLWFHISCSLWKQSHRCWHCSLQPIFNNGYGYHSFQIRKFNLTNDLFRILPFPLMNNILRYQNKHLALNEMLLMKSVNLFCYITDGFSHILIGFSYF